MFSPDCQGIFTLFYDGVDMKKVVLPTDFSENAWNATGYAIELFKDEECVFYLLNTYTPAFVNSRFMAAGVGGLEIEDDVKVQSEIGLNNLLKRIEENYDIPHHSFKTISSFSLLTSEVKEIASSKDIDLIITGTKGASGLEEVFMGSHYSSQSVTRSQSGSQYIPQTN